MLVCCRYVYRFVFRSFCVVWFDLISRTSLLHFSLAVVTGCNCDGVLFDSCGDHCSVDNESPFYIEVLPNPRRASGTIAGLFTGSGSSFAADHLAGYCYAGCARRARCAPKCCRRHPRCEAVKCAECMNLGMSDSEIEERDHDIDLSGGARPLRGMSLAHSLTSSTLRQPLCVS